MYLNATSLENKFHEFKVLVDTYRPQIIAVRETWFKIISIVNLNGYNLYRRDRNDGCRGGGVCLYIDRTIKSLELSDAVDDANGYITNIKNENGIEHNFSETLCKTPASACKCGDFSNVKLFCHYHF